MIPVKRKKKLLSIILVDKRCYFVSNKKLLINVSKIIYIIHIIYNRLIIKHNISIIWLLICQPKIMLAIKIKKWKKVVRNN